MKRDREPGEKNLTYLGSQDVDAGPGTYGWIACIMRCTLDYLPYVGASKSNILHVFAYIAQIHKLHVLGTVNTSRNRVFANHFLFAHSANA